MKLQDALRKIIREFGMSVMKDKRLMSFLTDYRAFDDFPAVKTVMRAIAEGGYGRDLCRLAADESDVNYLSYAGDLKKSLARDRNFRQEFADYAVDSISFALGLMASVIEPDDHGFDPTGKVAMNQEGIGAQGGTVKSPDAGNTGGPSPQVNDRADDFYRQGNDFSQGCGVKMNQAEAVRRWHKAADLGHAGAQCRLGHAYSSGAGVEENAAVAAMWYRKAAEQGNAEAQNCLGGMYMTGSGVKKDRKEAVSWYRKAAEQGLAEAQYEVAEAYHNGCGVDRDNDEAVIWYRKAADQDYTDSLEKLDQLYAAGFTPDSQYERGNSYFYGKGGVRQDLAEAARWYRRAAAQGHKDSQNILKSPLLALAIRASEEDDAAAQLRLGLMYAKGDGARQNSAEAARWYQKSANHGNADAQCNLGMMYRYGNGVSQDFPEAVRWYRKSAAQGCSEAENRLKERAIELFCQASEHNDPHAMYSLGRMYTEGKEVASDLTMAFDWFMKAAEQGDADAQCQLGDMYSSGLGVGQSYSKAMKWFSKAACHGIASAMYSLGSMYEYGKATAPDCNTAAEWYYQAASHGSLPAHYSLGRMYQEGKGVRQDVRTAVRWYRVAAAQGHKESQDMLRQPLIELFCKASEQGDADAQLRLGHMYFRGGWVKQDSIEALKWYRKSAEQGNDLAQYHIGLMYENGLGVTQNYHEALEWYRKSAEHGNEAAKGRIRELSGLRGTIKRFFGK